VYKAKDALVDEGYHPDYIRQVLQSLSALIEILREHDTIATKNVASRIKITKEDRKLAFANREVRVARKRTEANEAGRKPRRESQPPRAVTAEEFHATIQFTSPSWQARLKLAAATGVRPGELYAANRRNVHRDRQLIEIGENVSRGGELLDGTKNTYILQPGHRTRLTIFPASLLEELDATGIPVDGYWIRAPDGGLINANNFRNRVFKPMMEAAVSARCADYWTLKDLRHTFSTQLLGAGLPITHVARWMGDSVTVDDGAGGRRRVRSQAVTVYEHPDEAHVARAADIMRTYLRVGQQKLFGS
jgi:integrase